MRPSGLRAGFALLITITLVAFLVLVLVSLATLTRVETRVAANGQQLAQARSNALYALNLAIGQLQQHAGPDQAVTARADIDSANTGNPRWTGVWDAVPRDSAGAALTTPTHAVAPSSNAPLAWLVSGNEQNGVAITPASAAVDDPGGSNDNVWLLRTAFGRSLEADAANPVDGRIKLAKSAITAAARDVPGMDASSTDPVRLGSYAWWVGDEGIKAKVNLADPYRDAASTDEESAWRREAAPRPDLALLSKPEFANVFAGTSATFEDGRGRLLSDAQLVLLSTDLASGDGREQAGDYYHDLTLVGRGVLADTLRGGLRRDLTRGLATSPAGSSVAGAEIGDALPVFTLPAPGPVGRTAPSGTWTPNNEFPAPRWSLVRSFWARRATASGVMTPIDAPLVVSPAQAPSEHAFLPVPVMVQLGYGIDGGGTNYRFLCSPRVVLCNPYNVTLAPATYHVTHRPVNNTNVTFSFSPAAAGTAFSVPSAAARVTTTFTITEGFAPGEVKVFTPTADVAFDPSTDSTLALAVGFRPTYAYFDTAVAVNPAHQLPTSSVRIVLNAYTGSQHPEITLSLAGAVPSQRVRWIEVEPTRNGLESYNGAPVARPGGFIRSPELTREMLAMRFHLRDASMDINTAGNQPGAANHQVPSSHPAYSSWGGTVADASGSRMLIDNNPRAVVSQRLGGWDSVAHFGFDPVRGADLLFPVDGVNGFWGGGILGDAYSSTHVTLFDVLRDGEEVVSLGRLGHVNWGVDGKHPAYPLGNSFASIFYTHDTPDYGYALNEALWDRFFLSTLPATLSPRPARLPNTRLVFHDPAAGPADVTALEGAEGYELAATRLMIDGAFNINSTSVEAWTAFLGSVQASDYRYETRAGPRTDADVRPFPRLRAGHDPDPAQQTGNLYEWTGYRRLDAGQLRDLATAIVDGIKARGRPARSLAEFMNRDLSRPATDTLNQAGLVQAAINAVINTDEPDATGNGTGLTSLGGLNTSERVADTFQNADNPDAARGKLRATGAPGFLLQNDLLTPLAPAMSARSDTFKVRAYGESRNPATGEIMGEAWCEAVVQRLPEYVGGEDAELLPAALASGSDSERFGRKFIVTSFRWLTSEDL